MGVIDHLVVKESMSRASTTHPLYALNLTVATFLRQHHHRQDWEQKGMGDGRAWAVAGIDFSLLWAPKKHTNMGP